MTTAVTSTAKAADFSALGLTETGSTPNSAKAETQASADRFLTMLVTQLKNQDPLNPMDNAQITSQMAQINTVTGLEKVNESVKSLSSQMLQMQALQGASLVGRTVAVEGKALTVADGKGSGMIEIEGRATSVTVEILDINQKVVGTVNLGAKEAGRYSFDWSSGSYSASSGLSFRMAASNAGVAVAGRTLMNDRVQSVSTGSDGLNLTLARGGNVAASKVVAFN